MARLLKAKTRSPVGCRPSTSKAWPIISSVASVPRPRSWASGSPMGMWKRAVPLSGSRLEKVVRPTSRPLGRWWGGWGRGGRAARGRGRPGTRPSEKVPTLPASLRPLPPAELPLAVTYLSSRPFPERDPRTTGLGWAAIAAAAEADADAEDGGLGRAYDRPSVLARARQTVVG